MKKFSFLMIVLLSGVCLFACNSKSSINGQFLQEEYVLSLDEVKDFYDELDVVGVEKDELEITSSNTNILASDDGKEFKAVSSGKAYVFAKYKNKVSPAFGLARTGGSAKYCLIAARALSHLRFILPGWPL